MYKKGEIKTFTPKCPDCKRFDGDDGFEYTSCCELGHNHATYYSREDIDVKYVGIYLPHSCDDWVIGGIKEAKLMVADLQTAIKRMEKTA